MDYVTSHRGYLLQNLQERRFRNELGGTESFLAVVLVLSSQLLIPPHSMQAELATFLAQAPIGTGHEFQSPKSVRSLSCIVHLTQVA